MRERAAADTRFRWRRMPRARHPTSFVDELDRELEESGRCREWDVSIEDLFIGPDSDGDAYSLFTALHPDESPLAPLWIPVADGGYAEGSTADGGRSQLRVLREVANS